MNLSKGCYITHWNSRKPRELGLENWGGTRTMVKISNTSPVRKLLQLPQRIGTLGYSASIVDAENWTLSFAASRPLGFAPATNAVHWHNGFFVLSSQFQVQSWWVGLTETIFHPMPWQNYLSFSASTNTRQVRNCPSIKGDWMFVIENMLNTHCYVPICLTSGCYFWLSSSCSYTSKTKTEWNNSTLMYYTILHENKMYFHLPPKKENSTFHQLLHPARAPISLGKCILLFFFWLRHALIFCNYRILTTNMSYRK